MLTRFTLMLEKLPPVTAISIHETVSCEITHIDKGTI
jgi:hypothetical protein